MFNLKCVNNGKICVSTCAETIAELLRQIRRAEEFADVIEVRFDCLAEIDRRQALADLPSTNKQYLITFRPKAQGGKREITLAEQLKFWEYVFWKLEPGYMIDIELDPKLLLSINPNRTVRIVSFHDFEGSPENSLPIWTVLSGLAGNNIKFAAFAGDITNSISVWKMLDLAKSENKQITPIAMGEAGKWTRILGLAHGAFLTYASLESGSETAPGQIAAGDLIDVYRVKELDANTDVYGIIAGDTSYSVSPFMHNAAFKANGLNAVFVPLQVANLDEFICRMVKPETREVELNFQGFAVTNPHKTAIIKHLDHIDETAESIGAVNTVKIENGKLYGFNTDAHGFIAPLKEAFGNLSGTSVAVIGAGGAARAGIYALRLEGAKVTLFARDPVKARPLADAFDIDVRQLTTDGLIPKTPFDIIVNSTPLGTKGEFENQTIATGEQLRGVGMVYDLTYNPKETCLIREAAAAKVRAIGGLEMLIAQGAKQFEIWTGHPAPLDGMGSAVRKRLNAETRTK